MSPPPPPLPEEEDPPLRLSNRRYHLPAATFYFSRSRLHRRFGSWRLLSPPPLTSQFPAYAASARGGPLLHHGRSLANADLFARAFALVAHVEAFAYATPHIHRTHPGQLDSTNSINKDKINDIIGLQNLAKSLSAQNSGENFAMESWRHEDVAVKNYPCLE